MTVARYLCVRAIRQERAPTRDAPTGDGDGSPHTRGQEGGRGWVPAAVGTTGGEKKGDGRFAYRSYGGQGMGPRIREDTGGVGDVVGVKL